MALITRRRTGELVRELFVVLLPHADGMQAREALDAVRSRMTLTEYEEGSYDDGGSRFDKILRFATVDCVKAGWLIKDRGRWYLTDLGRDAFKAYQDPEAFYKRAVELYNVWRRGTPKPPVPDEDDDTVADPSITFEEAEEHAWQEIEHYLSQMPPYDFQDLVASLLRAMGYYVGWVAPPGRDGGIDILAFNDPLGTRPPRIKVQVKRQQSRVDVNGLRSFMALLAADDVGIFVNSGGFTKDAQDEGRTQQNRRVTLIDLERLVDLWTEHYAKLDEESRRRLPLTPIYFLAPED